MNHATRFTKLALLLIVAGALALAGCGGDDGDTAPPMPPDPDPALITAQEAAADAEAAAKTAYDAARSALAGVTGMEDADPASYARAQNDVADAKAAYDAAKAANAMAQAADMAAAAQAAQATAEAAQGDAEDARDAAVMHAGMVSTAHQAELDRIAAAAEMKALTDAQAAAMMAYDGAKAALAAAQAALAGVEDIKDADMASYDMAMAAVADAQSAYDAAAAANTAAMAAMDSADAKAEQAKAEQAEMDAETAQMNAMTYAGMVMTAHQTTMYAAERQAITAAQTAARDEWRAARAAFAAIAGKQSADPAAYQLAMDAVDDAEAAYDATLEATTSAEAERYQEDAEDANQRAMAQVALVIAAYDAPAIAAAQMAAKTAADAAKADYEAAMAALAAVEAIKAMDEESYNTAAMKVEAAKMAYETAKMAYEMAMTGTLLADVVAQRDAAQNASDDASTANTDAMMYAGMVQSAEDTALSSAKTDAQTAYDAAKMAYEAAKMRVDALSAVDDDGRAKKDDNVEDYVRAMDALTRTKAAYDMAMAANGMAQAATLSTTARGHADDVETHQGTVDTEKMGVDMYAGLVETAYNAAQRQRNTDEENRLAEEQRVRDVASARSMAMQSYMDADGDATKAEMAAKAAEATAPGSAGAIAARAAATAARNAANMAKAAHDAIMDDMTKEQADAQATTAATQAGTANTQYMAAKTQNDTIQTAHQIAEETQRVAGVMAAQREANKAVEAAKTAMDEADAAAMVAETARDNAKDAFDRAVDARTDSTKAEAEYMAAKTAAMMAREAANAAETAYMAAKMAAEGIMADGTVDAAEMARDTAQTKSGEAVTARMTAETEKGKAETAENNAMMFASSHALGLLMAANAVGVMDNPATEADERAAEVAKVATEIGTAAASTNAGRNDSRDAGATAVTAGVTWDADMPDDPDTDDNEFVAGSPVVTVSEVAGGDIVSDTVGMPNADPVVQPNAKRITGLPGFAIGLDITDSNNTTETSRDRHVLVFTDRKQATAAIPMQVVNVTNTPATASRIIENERIEQNQATPNATGRAVINTDLDTVADLTANARYDHDGNSDTLPLAGTFSCVPTDECTVIQVDANGQVVGVVGDGTLLFTATPARDGDGNPTAENFIGVTKAAVAADDMSADYLVFGVWIEEDADGGTAGLQPEIGAFADGGTEFVTPVTLTGEATYNGAAAGVYTEGESVDYFQADATLTADFGAPGAGGDPAAADDQEGIITGRIHNIMAGGRSMSDVISLNSGHTRVTPPADQVDGNIETGGAFAGTTSMGAPMVDGTVVTYMYNGTWSGQFYGPAAEADATGVDTLPPSLAGTFGVTGTDNMGTMDDATDDVTRSYLGAFGARR